MRVSLNLSGLSRTRWYEYALRFAFGGLVTALTGIVAKECGPAVGGLFLAFPAIFPASATLVENHEKQKKRRAGAEGVKRGRQAAALDAAGATVGSFGLLAFAVVAWKLVIAVPPWASLSVAIATWLIVSVLSWKLWKTRSAVRRRNHRVMIADTRARSRR